MWPRFGAAMDALLWALSIYMVPIAIGLASIAAIVLWDDQYAGGGSQPMPFQVLLDASGELNVAQAGAQLDRQPWVPRFDTRRSEKPIWFALAVPAEASSRSATIEFPSRHASAIACWVRPSSRRRRRRRGPTKSGLDSAIHKAYVNSLHLYKEYL